ncbi:Cationic amino acid transporter 2, vacuolar [Carex littledalei]|uniref:Cationic amino acid transporter 2, vacuolar n=1 Tax=Carex littledalei TaxID=544730 RepID=A0A833QSX2_9POAL|nr:Cationic amino acid transporter 2, vacuolar [Carex littledalei]
MAFPVVLKVCYLSELVRSCSGFKAPVHLTSFRWRKVVKRALWREEKERERERPRDLAGWYQRYWHKNCQRRCGSRWSVVIVGLVPYPAMDPDTPISTAFVENGMHWTMYVVSTGAILSICASLLVSVLLLYGIHHYGVRPNIIVDYQGQEKQFAAMVGNILKVLTMVGNILKVLKQKKQTDIPSSPTIVLLMWLWVFSTRMFFTD